MTTATRAQDVRRRVADATQAAGRDAEPLVVAVTKTHGPDTVTALRDLGMHDFGENRVSELVAKRAIAGVATDRWHLIGPLQRGRVNDIIGTGALVHTVDRVSLVDRMQRRCATTGTSQRVLVQVNVAEDPAKGGCRLDEAADLVAYIANTAEVTVEGLMTMAPFPEPGDDPNEQSQPHFATLRALRERLAADHPSVRELSMGMSGDLEAAIAEGSTIVRIGTALVGPRGDRPWEPLLDPSDDFHDASQGVT